jgi:hypothetical protein
MGPSGTNGTNGINGINGLSTWVVTPVKVADYTASPADFVRVGATCNITLPASPSVGDRVAVCREGGGFTATILPNSGQTIDGVASAKIPATGAVPYATVTFTYVAANLWRIEATANNDGNLGLVTAGPLYVAGGLSETVTAISGATTLSAAHTILDCSVPGAAYTITFGSAMRTGQLVLITNHAGTNNVNLAAAGTGSILGPTGITPNKSVLAIVLTAGANPVVAVLLTA